MITRSHCSPLLAIARVALVVAVTTGVAACGDDPSDQAEDTDAATTTSPSDTTVASSPGDFPVEVEYAGTTITIGESPSAIVSLSPTATEMLFAIGAGDQVEAADAFSNYPADAPTTDLDGNAPNVEALLGYEPDLVIVSFDPGDVVSGLESAGVPTLVLGSAVTLDDTYEQIDVLGQATGHTSEADALNDDIASDIAELVATVPERDEPLSYYHELDDTLYSITSSTFVGELYGLAGFASIADPADANGDAGGYPQLSAEFVIAADPDVIFLADAQCCGQTPETVGARPGWGDLRAVQAGNVIAVDEDIASRWGPRVVEYLRVVIEATKSIDTGA